MGLHFCLHTTTTSSSPLPRECPLPTERSMREREQPAAPYRPLVLCPVRGFPFPLSGLDLSHNCSFFPLERGMPEYNLSPLFFSSSFPHMRPIYSKREARRKRKRRRKEQMHFRGPCTVVVLAWPLHYFHIILSFRDSDNRANFVGENLAECCFL